MPHCPTCQKPAPPDAYHCPDCGTALPMDTSAPTEFGSAPPAPAAGVSDGSRNLGGSRAGNAASTGLPSQRFAAGTLLGDRYRIVSLRGQGGMGEVYRADDLTLGQPVALKFLPEAMAHDPLRMQRFLDEVRVARQVSHPNVCRVYDLGEYEGHRFLSMELIDGDDLAGLLRKVGRFPEDKALDIARQLCAGLQAAHRKGVIHRDLKPANIMIDARGQVHITDFGLAALAGTIGREEVVAGTPTYMAPEQLAGTEVTPRSDIYALGLVLYELFTGKPVYEPATLAELRHQHSSASPSSLSVHVTQIDPTIDRVILRCLERDPQKRPATPLDVAAALPGGDPLAAALAAGETPSPEMVAAAGSEGTLPPLAAAGLVAAGILFFLLAAIAGLETGIFGIYDWEKPPSFLAERGREIANRLQPDRSVVDDDWGLQMTWGYFSHQMEEDETADRWRELRDGSISIGRVWYRSSPQRFEPSPGFSTVTSENPSQVVPGEVLVVLNDRGRLTEYSRIPERFDDREMANAAIDWSPFFEEAQLDRTQFRTVPPIWTPPMAADVRAAWEGPDPLQPRRTLRLEAAAWKGELVHFRVREPWVKPGGTGQWELTTGQRITQVVDLLLQIGLLVGAALLARRNVRLGRSDLTGAFRLAFGFLTIHTIVWALWAHHAPMSAIQAEWSIFQMDTGYNLFLTASLWVYYVGLEPFVRRRWPESLISWTRLLSGRIRDPLVGRDVLLGVAVGSLVSLLARLSEKAPLWMGALPDRPRGIYMARDLWNSIGWVLDKPVHSVLSMMQGLLLIVVLSLIVRHRVAAAVLAGLLFLALSISQVTHPAVTGPFLALAIGLVLWLLLRYGLLAATLAQAVITVQSSLPISRDLGAWHQVTLWTTTVSLLLLLGWAYRTATDDRGLLRESLLDG